MLILHFEIPLGAQRFMLNFAMNSFFEKDFSFSGFRHFFIKSHIFDPVLAGTWWTCSAYATHKHARQNRIPLDKPMNCGLFNAPIGWRNGRAKDRKENKKLNVIFDHPPETCPLQHESNNNAFSTQCTSL